jgi:glucosyl-3-phosphoglycerate synthase
MPNRFDWRSFTAAGLAQAKDRLGLRAAVCIPARNEAGTVGEIVSVVHEELVMRHQLVDELVVVDDGSSDATAEQARSAGATVLAMGSGPGKGEAMRYGLDATTSDLIAYCDADIYDFTPRFVLGLLGPLLTDPSTALVKGAYRRPLDGVPGEGGRVTELVAKPLIELLFPELAAVRQPLAGEWASRREILEPLSYAEGYGVEMGILVDIAREYGPSAIAECDLGERRHRNRPLAELAPMARTVMRLGLERAGLLPAR